MGMLDFLLGDNNQERTITVKSKPMKDQPPEAPLDSGSANLPEPVMELMRMQAKAMNPAQQPLDGQMPMDAAEPFPPAVMQMMSQPAGLRELENAGSYANRQVRRQRMRNQNGIHGLLDMMFGPGYKNFDLPAGTPYVPSHDEDNPYYVPPSGAVVSPNRT